MKVFGIIVILALCIGSLSAAAHAFVDGPLCGMSAVLMDCCDDDGDHCADMSCGDCVTQVVPGSLFLFSAVFFSDAPVVATIHGLLRDAAYPDLRPPDVRAAFA